MKDSQGRVVLLRGTNFDAGLRRPSAQGDLSAAALDDHAATMARLGFNVARLQLTWGAMEPGRLGPNDPRVCSPGPPADPGQWDEAHARRYLDRVDRVVHALARHGIATLFQIAQYAYNERFGGPPSHPDWAVCTDGVPITPGVGPSAYAQPGMWVAADHFWNNDVRGNLQGEYDRMLRALAARFASSRAIAGYELYNEPFSSSGWTPDAHFDALVQCFYGGRADPGRLADGSRPSCPTGVPAAGAIPQMRAVDRTHMLHPQAHIYTNFGVDTRMGPLPAENLAFNFHVYCPSGLGTQVPDQLRGPECDTTEENATDQAERTRRAMGSPREPGPLPGFMSEFGFGDNEAMLRHLTTLADRHLLGWAYFTWRNGDGADNEGVLRNSNGSLRPKVRFLARPYPSATAGTPSAMSYDPDRRFFDLTYAPRRAQGDARTVVVLPDVTYGHDGACPEVDGGEWRLTGGDLLVAARSGVSRVRVRVRPGRCGASSRERRVCLNSRRGARGDRLGPARLGRTRAAQRRRLKGKRLRSRGGIDRYCATGGGSFRIGYPTRRLMRAAPTNRLRRRVVFILTSSAHFKVGGVRRGTKVRELRSRLRRGRRLRVGRNEWYLAPGRRSRLLFKLRRGQVVAVGIAERRLTASRRGQVRFLRSWRAP